MYKIRVILDTKEDVIRTILVESDLNLEDLHLTIAKSFGFKGQEMASFIEQIMNGLKVRRFHYLIWKKLEKVFP